MPHRYICTVLEEMRDCQKTHNYALLESLIAEIQIMANRMEAALWEQKDHETVHKEIKVAKRSLEEVNEKIRKAQVGD